MNSKFPSKYCLLIIPIAAAMLAGCGGTGNAGEGAEFPWSINIPELSLRLVVYDLGVELYQYPMCLIEVMNTSKQTILLRKDFAINGPAIYDKNGNPMPQRNPLEVKPGETGCYRLEPGQKVSVKATPNYKIEDTGTYFLKFAIHPSWWGYEDSQQPGKMIAKQEGPTAISNEVRILVYSGEK
jgi:hypothetical protein